MKFTQRQALKAHENSVHIKARVFVCDRVGCGKAFLSKGTLNLHKQCVHDNKRPHVCDYPGCDQTFGQASGLKIHKKSVHERIYDFACAPIPGATSRARIALTS
jgi:general transcription factor IIIA